MFNEFFIALVTLYMCCFTDFVTDKATQFDAGWQMVGIMVLNMFVNMMIVLLVGFKGLILLGIRWVKLGWFYGKKFIFYTMELSVQI
jgi:hypothetical protein